MSRAELPALLYLCYGPREIHLQAAYSILSLLHVQGGPPKDCRVLVYCDRPEEFGDLPVEIVPIDAPLLESWLGGSDYIHRRKICAIINALEYQAERVAFIDTDTWFRRPPAALFRRINPGCACFHLCEGYVLSTGTPFDAALARQLLSGNYALTDSTPVKIGRTTAMWNTGVVGVHRADLPRVERALALSDAIWAGADPHGAYGRKIHHAEQFAMGYAFRDCRLSEAADVIYHYWPREAKQLFTVELSDLIPAGMLDRSLANLALLYARRYRETGFVASRDRAKMALRKFGQAVGWPLPGVRRSVG